MGLTVGDAFNAFEKAKKSGDWRDAAEKLHEIARFLEDEVTRQHRINVSLHNQVNGHPHPGFTMHIPWSTPTEPGHYWCWEADYCTSWDIVEVVADKKGRLYVSGDDEWPDIPLDDRGEVDPDGCPVDAFKPHTWGPRALPPNLDPRSERWST